MSTTHADPADQRQHLIAQARQYLTEHEKTWDAENEATYQKYMDKIREATEAAEFRTGGVSQEEADRIMAGMYATGSGAPGRQHLYPRRRRSPRVVPPRRRQQEPDDAGHHPVG